MTPKEKSIRESLGRAALRFKDLQPGDVFRFAAEVEGVKGLRWSGAHGPWIKTGARSYSHKETGQESRVGSINVAVYKENPVSRFGAGKVSRIWARRGRQVVGGMEYPKGMKRRAKRSLRQMYGSRGLVLRNPSSGPISWVMVAEMRAGEPGTEYGIDAVTPVNWIITRKRFHAREYGYLLPDALTTSPGFVNWMAGERKKVVNASLSQLRAKFRAWLPPDYKPKKNPAPRDARALAPQGLIEQAAKLYRQFTGHKVTTGKQVKLPAASVGLAVGPVLAVAYETTRDGKHEKYIHEFRRGARPLLASSHDGRSLYLLGGAYRFTERGIVDKG